MGKGEKGHCKDKTRRMQRKALCIVCTVVLVILIIILAILYFSLFRPKDPRVQVPTMQLLSLYPAGYPLTVTSVNVTVNLQVYLYNPNRAPFYVTDGSTACLYYYGNQVGFTPVPSVTIPSQASTNVAVTLTVQGLNPLEGPYLSADVAAGILPISTTVTILGHVTTLNIFSHHTDVVSKCNVNVTLNSRGIEAYTCQKTYSIED